MEKERGGGRLGLIRNLLLVLVGTLILAFGTAVFILPFHMVVGGMSGLAILIEGWFPLWGIGVDRIVAILSWGLFFAGWLLLGRSFALRTLVSAAVYPMAISFFLHLTSPDVLGGALYLAGNPQTDLTLIISAVAGGACMGAGCALSFLGGGSTGGVDVIALSLCRVFKRLRSSLVHFLLDATVIVLGFFLSGDLLLTLLGIISALISALVIDRVFLGGSAALAAQIVTDRGEEITRAVIEKLDRTATVLNVTGGYTGERKQLLLVSFRMRQYAELTRLVNLVDPNAFLTVYKAHAISGEGWTK